MLSSLFLNAVLTPLRNGADNTEAQVSEPEVRTLEQTGEYRNWFVRNTSCAAETDAEGRCLLADGLHNELFGGFLRQGTAPEEALDEITADFAQGVQLGLLFNALGNDVKTHDVAD